MADIKHFFHIKEPAEKIYEAITTVRGLQNWWTIQTTGNASEGGTLEFRFGAMMFNQMKVIKTTTNQQVHWECMGGHKDWIGTRISFELQSKEDQVMLRFHHSNWPEANDFYAQCNHTWGRYMQSLKNYCEKGEGEPFKC